MSFSVVPNGSVARQVEAVHGRAAARRRSRPRAASSVRSSAPIISCAMLFAVSALGSQVADHLAAAQDRGAVARAL